MEDDTKKIIRRAANLQRAGEAETQSGEGGGLFPTSSVSNMLSRQARIIHHASHAPPSLYSSHSTFEILAELSFFYETVRACIEKRSMHFKPLCRPHNLPCN